MADLLRAVCIGDIHLDALNKYNHVFKLMPGELTYNEILEFEIQKIYAYAEREGIEHVWFLGDISERPRMTQEAHEVWLRTQLDPTRRKFQTKGIIGNHDFEDITFHSMQVFQAALGSGQFPHIKFYYGAPVTETIDGIDVGFLPYPHITSPRSTKRKQGDERPKAYLGHFDVAGAKRDNGRLMETGADAELDTSDFWIIGHIHTYQVPKPNVVLPGTVHQLNFGESLPKGFLDISFKYEGDKLLKKYAWVENEPLYKLINLPITCQSDFDQIENNPAQLYKLFIKKGVELPTTLLRSRPNIVNNLQYKDDGELVEIMRQEISLEVGDGATVSFDEKVELSTILKTRGLTESQIERGFEMLRKIKVFGDEAAT